MIRLTLVLLAAIGLAMVVGGRDFSPAEAARLGIGQQPTHSVVVARADTSGAMPAGAAAAAEAPDPAAVSEAVALALNPAPAPAKAAQAQAQVVQASAQPADQQPAPAPADVAAADPAAVQPDPTLSEEIDTALSDSQVWYVTGNVVNVREGPATSFPVVGQVSYGEATEILGDPGDSWVRIRIQGDGVEGFISSRFLSDVEPNG